MDGLLDLRLIRFFSFYLAVVFVVSTFLRLRQYRAVLSLVVRLRSRWPNLTALVLTHRHIFLTPRTYLPLVIVLALLAANMLASRLVWPQADRFDVRELLHLWPAIPFVLATGVAMVAFDTLGTVRVGEVDQTLLEGYFDQAEGWLRGWKAPVVRFLSLGYIDPRQLVDKEVRGALEMASDLLNNTLWWVSAQAVLRILFGLCLWSSYALRFSLAP
ncbi:MAG: hypothetical protein U0797_02910 [Gemmataceae bacterium]